VAWGVTQIVPPDSFQAMGFQEQRKRQRTAVKSPRRSPRSTPNGIGMHMLDGRAALDELGSRIGIMD
jgi:hypothetical protein